MTQPSQVRVYMATSLDGFIAEPDDDMSFLPPVPTASEDLVATTRELDPMAPSVRAVSGSSASLVDQARGVAAGKDVYLDGGALIRSALAASLVDEMCLFVVPVVLGGVHLFDGLSTRADFELLGTMVPLTVTAHR